MDLSINKTYKIMLYYMPNSEWAGQKLQEIFSLSDKHQIGRRMWDLLDAARELAYD